MSDLLTVYKKFLERRHKSYRHKSPRRVFTDAELIWTGENYILVREGPLEGNRSTVLVDKGGLMLLRGNGSSALETLAACTLHPAQIRLVQDRRIELHNSRGGERWSKSLVERLIAQARDYDEAYEGEFEKIKTEFDDRNKLSQEAVAAAQSLGLTVCGTSSRDGIEWPAGEQFELHTEHAWDRIGIFHVGCLDGEINVQVTGRLSNLTLDQFKRLVSLLKEIKETEESEESE